MWEHVELREIRVFLMLCEELHFGRTAERLRVSQTRVSQTIQELEARWAPGCSSAPAAASR
jgi:DNA-binding transcriptional LysR family regulator